MCFHNVAHTQPEMPFSITKIYLFFKATCQGELLHRAFITSILHRIADECLVLECVYVWVCMYVCVYGREYVYMHMYVCVLPYTLTASAWAPLISPSFSISFPTDLGAS